MSLKKKFDTISGRLLAGYVIIIFASVLGALVSVITLKWSIGLDKSISKVEVPSIESLKDLKSQTKELKKLSSIYIYQANQDDKKSLLTILSLDYPKVLSDLKTSSQMWEVTSQTESFSQVNDFSMLLVKDVKNLMTTLNSEEDYSNDVKVDEGINLFENGIVAKNDKMLELLDTIIKDKVAFLAQAQSKKENAFFILFIVLLIVLVVILVTSYTMMQSSKRWIVNPIRNINNAVIKLGAGEIPEKQGSSQLEEIQLMHQSINQLVDGTKGKIDFAEKLGDGDYIVQFNLLSEKDVLGEALLEMRDKLKKNQEEILDKTRKITESINYSHRIQSSLLPTEGILKSTFSDLFMFYKPKDVVSGDFPYFYKHDDYAYLATVDCTGHGVPGALMSFIGYFTLNQIMNENNHSKTTGQILDELHQKVQKTLKQDVNKDAAKDGMDVAICKINTKTLQLEYSGAHRPLYLILNGDFSEIKADRYPIGGIFYKGRLPFRTHCFQLSKGDSILFNTDGLPDQFGGINGKEKFMSKRVRELIEKNKTVSMSHMKEVIEHEFDTWKGDYRQIDDILMIGVKL